MLSRINLRSLPLHPLFLAAFPVLSVFSQDVGYVGIASVVWVLLAVLGVAVALVVGFSLTLRNLAKGGLVASVAIVLLFSFSTMTELFEGMGGARPRYLLAFDLFVIVALIAALWRKRVDISKATPTLNQVAALFPGVAIIFAIIGAVQGGATLPSSAEGRQQQADFNLQPVADADALRDIYYIVLDGYGRSDVLQELFGHDNSAFIDDLEAIHFQVAGNSFANYSTTAQSIASALNMDYIQSMYPRVPEDVTDLEPITRSIERNTVASLLKARYGYKFVAFASGFRLTEAKGADYYLGPGIDWGEFGNAVMHFTPLNFLFEKAFSVLSPYTLHRERTLFVLNNLPRIADIEAPTFTFAHILGPHPPFLFDADGRDVSPRDRRYSMADVADFMPGNTMEEKQDYYRRGYVGQVEYLSQAIVRTIEEIQARSEVEPIIVIQGDHGPFSHASDDSEASRAAERFPILNAYSLPDADSGLPNSITPVNSFRMILRRYFGSDAELLPNEVFWSFYEAPFHYEKAAFPHDQQRYDANL